MWGATGTPKPTSHPAFKAFEAWFENANTRRGADLSDHPIWWECYVAGFAQGCLTYPADTKTAPEPASPAVPDLDVLRDACDAPDPLDRAQAISEIERRMRENRCCPKVALLKGWLARVNVEAPQQARRDALARCRSKYNLTVEFWF